MERKEVGSKHTMSREGEGGEKVGESDRRSVSEAVKEGVCERVGGGGQIEIISYNLNSPGSLGDQHKN